MFEPIVEVLLNLRESSGNGLFLALTLGIAFVLCLWGIPKITDAMVDSVAGLAGKYFGPKHRTMAINASTNNPELFLMLVSLLMLNLGGIATPLGSNLANLYLMFLVAPLWVMYTSNREEKGSFVGLLKKEKKLVCWHITASLGLFLISSCAFWCLTGKLPIGGGGEGDTVRGVNWVLAAAGCCALGMLVMWLFDRRLKQDRPEIFQDIDSSGENASWVVFLISTAGLVFCSLTMNVLFMAWTEAYEVRLSALLGAAVFTGIHYFAGALITSLPEMTVAIANYKRLRSPDLNTAMGSASYSNFSNLGIALLGCLLGGLLLLLGVEVSR